jgi:predicted transcriptional regulator
MVGTTAGRVALFSIHPSFASAILEGSKQVEFRRQGLPEDVTHVVIYATAPVQQIVGMFEIEGIDKVTPPRAWMRYRHVGGIEKTAFERYYTSAQHAFVIRVRDPQTFKTPFSLTDLDDNLRPPQSYMYLRGDLLVRARALADRPAVPSNRTPGEDVATKVLAPVGQ